MRPCSINQTAQRPSYTVGRAYEHKEEGCPLFQNRTAQSSAIHRLLLGQPPCTTVRARVRALVYTNQIHYRYVICHWSACVQLHSIVGCDFGIGCAWTPKSRRACGEENTIAFPLSESVVYPGTGTRVEYRRISMKPNQTKATKLNQIEAFRDLSSQSQIEPAKPEDMSMHLLALLTLET